MNYEKIILLNNRKKLIYLKFMQISQNWENILSFI